jgi:hypothetical protein
MTIVIGDWGMTIVIADWGMTIVIADWGVTNITGDCRISTPIRNRQSVNRHSPIGNPNLQSAVANRQSG